MSNRLYKSRDQKVLDGVCGGLAEYLQVDPVLIRVLWVVISIFAGAGVFGIFAYLIAMIIMPSRPEGITPRKQYVDKGSGELIADEEPSSSSADDLYHSDEQTYEQEVSENRQKLKTWLGLFLILIGGGVLFERIVGIDLSWWLYHYSSYLWPMGLIALGILLLTRRGS